MLNLFFTIVFLAEIILAHWLISKIIKLDNYVKALNFLVVDRQSEYLKDKDIIKADFDY